jgi:hypothetical protein
MPLARLLMKPDSQTIEFDAVNETAGQAEPCLSAHVARNAELTAEEREAAEAEAEEWARRVNCC